jgi:hypothetical protein
MKTPGPWGGRQSGTDHGTKLTPIKSKKAIPCARKEPKSLAVRPKFLMTLPSFSRHGESGPGTTRTRDISSLADGQWVAAETLGCHPLHADGRFRCLPLGSDGLLFANLESKLAVATNHTVELGQLGG